MPKTLKAANSAARGGLRRDRRGASGDVVVGRRARGGATCSAVGSTALRWVGLPRGRVRAAHLRDGRLGAELDARNRGACAPLVGLVEDRVVVGVVVGLAVVRAQVLELVAAVGKARRAVPERVGLDTCCISDECQYTAR